MSDINFDGDFILISENIATLSADVAGDYGLIKNAALVIRDGMIDWVGPFDQLPPHNNDLRKIDCGDNLITPALIDCHTHIVAGGNRAREFEQRLNGATYEEIARAGGGIISTVNATRQWSEEQLLTDALPRVDALIAEGVSLIEIKSGYGLNIETELKMLRVARRIEQERSIRVTTSYLAAHAVPEDYKDKPDAYIDEICIPGLEQAHGEGLVDCVDGFCEKIAFTPEQIERVFIKAKELGLPVKLHAEQLSNLGGAIMAARHTALSVDHIEYLSEEGVSAVAKSGTSAVLLPGAFYNLRETQAPPINLLRSYQVPMAIATDCNPGSSPLASLLLTMNMACTLFKLTPQEALAGVTREAARALNFNDAGTLEIGKRADISVWNVKEPAELAYRIGFNPLKMRIFGGKIG